MNIGIFVYSILFSTLNDDYKIQLVCYTEIIICINEALRTRISKTQTYEHAMMNQRWLMNHRG